MHAYYVKDGRMTYEGQYLLDPKYMTKRDLQYYYRYYNTASKGRGQCKRALLIIFCMCFFSYLFMDYNLKHNVLQLKSHFDLAGHIETPQEYSISGNDNPSSDSNNDDINKPTQLPNYLVNEPGCRIPYLNEEEIHILKRIQNDVHLCDDHKLLITPASSVSSVQQQLNVSHKHLSIMLLGVDGLSRLGFHRQFQRSDEFIRSHFKHIEFCGFNKAAEDTYGNLIPILSGLDKSELELACLDQTTLGEGNIKQSQRLDNCPFVWHRYKEAGFLTLYAEDTTTHTSLHKYFKHQPTDYYKPPFAKKTKIHKDCLMDQQFIDLVHYVKRLLPQMLKTDFLSYIWFNAKGSEKLDIALQRMLVHLVNNNLSNNTIIFLMSTHGQQLEGYQGQTKYQIVMEERQPLLVALYPEWFEDVYPNAIQNLRMNAHRLTTPFDLHATLLDLLKPSVKLSNKHLLIRSIELRESINNDENIPRGISLFLSIPPTRGCDNAGISAIYCTCQQTLELQTNDARAQEVARFIVQNINARLTQHPQCRVLHLHAILQARISTPQRIITKDIHGGFNSDYLIRIQTKPGLAEFETEIRRLSNGLMRLMTPISRLNLHRGQSYCIDEDKLKMFCYCPR